MSNSEVEPRLPIDPQDDELTRYQSVSGLAFAALLLGLLSWTAMFTPWLWWVAFAGVATGAAALARIRRLAPALLGRKPALIGLLLSVAFSFAGPAEMLANRWLIRNEGRRIAAEFLRDIRQGRPAAAHQLTLPAGRRAPAGVDLEGSYYYAGSDSRAGLEALVAQPEIQTLLTLDGKARIRYYDTQLQGHDDEGDMLHLVYAVTYDQAGRKTSFFLGLSLRRRVLAAAHLVDWQVLPEGIQGGLHADAYVSR
jgi:hypothetical protein